MESKEIKSLRFSNALEAEGFQRLVALATSLRDRQDERALRVFEVLLAGNELLDTDDKSDTPSIVANQWASFMDDTIARDLDSKSISRFVELVLQFHQSAAQAAKAHQRHAESRALKDDVFQWCEAHFHEFASMDAVAEEIARKVVPVKFRTARDWVGQWKKQRSPGIP